MGFGNLGIPQAVEQAKEQAKLTEKDLDDIQKENELIVKLATVEGLNIYITGTGSASYMVCNRNLIPTSDTQANTLRALSGSARTSQNRCARKRGIPGRAPSVKRAGGPTSFKPQA